MKPIWPGIIACCLIGAAGCERKPEPAEVRIASRTWKVELALTEDARFRGLSDRAILGADEGMLFVYPSPRPLEFCMRRCVLPLDIAFLDEELRVVAIHTMAVEPYGEERRLYRSIVPAKYALEVNAGDFARAGVLVGQKAVFSQVIPRGN